MRHRCYIDVETGQVVMVDRPRVWPWLLALAAAAGTIGWILRGWAL